MSTSRILFFTIVAFGCDSSSPSPGPSMRDPTANMQGVSDDAGLLADSAGPAPDATTTPIDAGHPVDSGVSASWPDASPRHDASAAPDATVTADSGVSGSRDAATGVDAGQTADPHQGVVGCDQMSCDLSTSLCCVGLSGSSCKPIADGCGRLEAPQHCDGPEDCTGADICCVGFPAGANCKTACGGLEQELCHATSDCSTSGDSCQLCMFPGGSANVCTTRC